MTEKPEKIVASRRSFLKLVGAGAVAGSAVAASTTKSEAAEPVREGANYRETEHVRRYYELAKF